MADWQLIETAPKDVPILVWAPSAPGETPVWVVVKDDDDFNIEHDGDGLWMDARNAHPTHWMPLPAPPSEPTAA
jgi:hypothetical protein